MIEVNKTPEYKSGNLPDKSGWSALSTITTFDRGKSESPNWKKGNALVSKKRATCTTSSLLVESLIDQLCKIFEKDPVSQKILYKLICKKLCDMKLIDKTYKIEEYQFMRTYYQRALYNLLSVSRSPTIDTKLETFLNQSPNALSLPPPLTAKFDWSRYQNEFEEIDFIARGGFGRVFRVKNKVDGCEYAIKKICLRYQSKDQFIHSLREVRTLANLDHPNIVAYKAAWFEPFGGVVAEGGSSGSSSPKVSPELGTSEPESSVSEQEYKYEFEEDSGNIIFTDKIEETSEQKENISFHHKFSSKDDKCTPAENYSIDYKERVAEVFGSYHKKILNYSVGNASLCDHNSKSTNKACRGRKLVRPQRGYELAVLHIQMQLCKESLREWLDLRNESLRLKSLEELSSDANSDVSTEIKQLPLDSESLSKALHIFLKILNGVEYVHAKGIIHHDLKPSNIFVEGYDYSSNDVESKGDYAMEGAESLLKSMDKNLRSQVRVGDFGLACHLSHQISSDVENNEVEDKALSVIQTPMLDKTNCLVQMVNHEPGDEKVKEVIGTKLYAAPEQLEGQCNVKSDMYSLGIILFELLHPFFTGMERNKVLSELRNGIIPTNFEDDYPVLVPMIRTLLSQNPSIRPSIKELIKTIKPILKGVRKLSIDSDICLNNQSSFKEFTFIQETKTEEVFRVSHFEDQGARELHRISNNTLEETSVEVKFLPFVCGNATCRDVREEQERTISKLMEENLQKDETIKKLKQQILELQNSSSIGDILDN